MYKEKENTKDTASHLFGACPRCGSKKVQKKKTSIKCKECGLECFSGNVNDAAKIWNRPKENKMLLISKCIKQYGNCYVGKFTIDLFGGIEAVEAEIEKDTGIPITHHSESKTDDVILEVDKAKKTA